MELLHKLENNILTRTKGVAHLPAAGQKWLGENIWWIVLIGAITSGIAVLFAIGGLFTLIALLGAASSTVYSYYVVNAVSGWSLVAAIVGLLFLIGQVALLILAVTPLRQQARKGWVLLFGAWLLQVVAVLINAVFSLSIVGFILGIIFGAIGLAITGYFLFEARGQFTVKATAKTGKKA